MPKLQQSTEHYGVGQSGYTTGRSEPDRALEENIWARNFGYPKDHDEDQPEPDDDRWVGRGGPQWYPEPADEASDDSTDEKP